MTASFSPSSNRILLFIALCAGMMPVGLAFWPAGRAQAAGVDTDCSDPYATNGFYEKLGGGGLVTFNCPVLGPTVITVSNVIASINTTVDGTNNGHTITLSGGNSARVFDQWVVNGTLTLTHLIVSDGFTANDGGGCILNEGAVVVLIDVTVTNCRGRTPAVSSTAAARCG